MEIKKIDEATYEVDGVQVWYHDGVARCVECSGPLVAMSKSCRHARAVKRLTKRAEDGCPHLSAEFDYICMRCGELVPPAAAQNGVSGAIDYTNEKGTDAPRSTRRNRR